MTVDKRRSRDPKCSTFMKSISSAALSALLACGAAAFAVSQNGPAGAVHFEDIHTQAGLNSPIVYGGQEKQKFILETTGTGVAIFDFDQDDYPDIFFVNGTRLANSAGSQPTNLLYRNLQDGTFRDVTQSAGLARSGWGQAVCVGDYDNDGKTDLLATYYGENVLYRNRGDGKFSDVSEAAGLRSPGRWNSGCSFLDYDRDGDLDLFVANYLDFKDATRYEPGSGPNCRWKGMAVMCGPTGLKTSPNVLYRNNGKGTFSDVSAASGIAKTTGCYGFVPVTLDFDQDGWPDLFVSCDSTPNLLYRNNRDGTFAEIGMESGVAVNEDGKEQASMGVAVGDYDRDGLLDLFVTNFSDDTPTLYHASRDRTFTDATYQAKLGLSTQFLSWGTALADLDQDGWKDLFIVSGHVYPEVDSHPSEASYRQRRSVYRNLANGRFQDISVQAGPGILEKKASRGLAFEDLDRDGSLEAVVVNLNDSPSLLKNQAKGKGNWVILQLEGSRSNRSAIGARVQLTTEGRLQTDEVRSASSYYSSNGLRLHFGLGRTAEIEKMEIFWPSRTRQVFENVRGNRVISVHETQGIR
jgi:enediyne biosynthesis protein E4